MISERQAQLDKGDRGRRPQIAERAMSARPPRNASPRPPQNPFRKSRPARSGTLGEIGLSVGLGGGGPGGPPALKAALRRGTSSTRSDREDDSHGSWRLCVLSMTLRRTRIMASCSERPGTTIDSAKAEAKGLFPASPSSAFVPGAVEKAIMRFLRTSSFFRPTATAPRVLAANGSSRQASRTRAARPRRISVLPAIAGGARGEFAWTDPPSPDWYRSRPRNLQPPGPLRPSQRRYPG